MTIPAVKNHGISYTPKCRKCRGVVYTAEEMTEQGPIVVEKCIICGERIKERPRDLHKYKEIPDTVFQVKANRETTLEFFAANQKPCTKEGCPGLYHDVHRNRSCLCLSCRTMQQKWESRKRLGKAFGPSPLLKTDSGWIDNPEYLEVAKNGKKVRDNAA